MKKIFIAAHFLSIVGVVSSCGQNGSKQNTDGIAKKDKVVLLDNYFNNEFKEVNGKPVKWHYLWEDTSVGGFSELGDIFKKEGATLATLTDAPTTENLKGAAIYIIADPDNEKETAHPNFMTAGYASAIAGWVEEGGVLVLLGNDSSNCELDKFNILSQKFGITFNKDNRLAVQDPHFEQGEVKINAGNPIFKTANNIYIKGICSVTAVAPATIVLKGREYNVTSAGEVGSTLQPDDFGVIAISKYGKGTVFALGDPWIYNEYIGHRRLPQQFENDKASVDWVKWLIEQTRSN